jgi:hypothetical protein
MRWAQGYRPSMWLLVVLIAALLATKSLNVCHCSPLGKGYSVDNNAHYLVRAFP